MPTQIQLRRGTTSEHSSFTGAAGEVTVDTTKKTLVVHDGSTAGGIPMAKENNATLAGNVTVSGGTANGVAYLNGSKVLTTGSALTFDGSKLLVGSNTAGYGTLNVARDATTPYASLTITDEANASNTVGLYLRQSGSSAAGISTAGAPLAFYLGGAGASESMRLDSTGLGIGQSSPAYIVDAYSPASVASSLCRIRVQGTTNYSIFQAQNTGGILWAGLENSAGGSLFSGTAAYSGVIGTTAAYPLAFATNGAERARITSSGDLLVGTQSTTAPGCVLAAVGRVAGTVSAVGTACFQAWNQATSGDNLFKQFYTEGGGGTLRGSIDYNRAGGLVRYNTTSDYRAKDIIGPVQNPGATIDALTVYEGKMKGATQSRPMLVAHEAQEHAPYAVSGVKDEVNEDGTPKFQQIDVSSLVPLLLAEIQSLRARVAQLEGN